MSGQLNSLGVITFFANTVGGKLVSLNLGWPAVFGVLNAAYFGLHYMFASQTAHVGALYAAFLAMMLSAGALLGLVLSRLNRFDAGHQLCCGLQPEGVHHRTILTGKGVGGVIAKVFRACWAR